MLSLLPYAAVRRWILAALSCTTLTATLCAASAPPAGAMGTYVVQACSDAAFEYALPVSDAFGGWLGEVSQPDDSHKTVNDCAGTLGIFMSLKGVDRKAAGDYAGWKAHAPVGTRITAAALAWDAYTRPSNGATQGEFGIRASGMNAWLFAERGLGATTDHVSVFNSLDAGWLSAMVYCDPVVGTPDCPSGEDATAILKRAVLTFSDATPPLLLHAEGSALDTDSWADTEVVSASATDVGSGVAEFRWYVDGELVVRDTPDDNAGACIPDSVDGDVPMYHAPKPCPGSVTVVEDLDTFNLEDGAHQMDLAVADASGRETPIFSGTKVIANHPPAVDVAPAFADAARGAAPHVGEDLVASRGMWSGPNLTYAVGWERCEDDGSGCVQVPGATVETYAPTAADLGKRLRMAVTATNPADSVTARTPLSAKVAAAPAPSGGTTAGGGTTTSGTPSGGTTTGGTTTAGAPGLPTGTTGGPPAPEPPHELVGRVAGEPSSATCPQDRATLVLQGVSGRTVKLGYGRAGSAAVLLTCTSTGKAIAAARLDVATRIGTRAAVASQITTDGSGRAVLRLGRGPSRAITVGYRMYADDPLARATVTLRVAVRGRVALRASRRVLRNGQALRLSGALAGGRVPRRGVDLAVQWRDGRRWRPFAQVRSDRRGRFHYAYRFTRTRGSVRYALRVQVLKGQVDYPYAPAASKAVRVVVRG